MATIRQVEEWRRIEYAIAWNARIQLGGDTPRLPDLMPYAFDAPLSKSKGIDTIGSAALHANMKANIRQRNKGKSYG